MIEVSENTMNRMNALLQGIEGAKGKVLRPAFGRAMQSGKTEAKRQATQTYHIKPGDFNENSRIQYNGINENANEIIGSISFAGHPIKLIKYNVSPKTVPKKSIAPRANVLRANPQVKFNRRNDVFIQQMKSGHIGIYERNEEGKFKELYAPSVPKMIENEKVMQTIEDRVNEVINQRIDHEIERLLSKSGG